MRVRLQVRVWFGQTVIAQRVDEAVKAHWYAEGMRRRFPSCRVSVDRLPDLEAMAVR